MPHGDPVAGEAEPFQGVDGEGDHLGVRQGPAGADQLHPGLGELAVAPFGGPLVAEDGAPAVDLGREAGRRLADEGAHQRGRQLGAQAEAPAPQVVEGVELGDDLQAGLAQVQLGRLEDRDVDPPVAGAGEGPLQAAAHGVQGQGLPRPEVLRAPHPLHGAALGRTLHQPPAPVAPVARSALVAPGAGAIRG